MKATPSELTYLRTLVRTRSAIVIEPCKDYLLEARLAPVARDAGFDSLGGLVDGLRAPRTPDTAALEKRVIEAMTTNETLFFRDTHPFAVLESRVIPELVRARPNRSLCLWSAACSTGQEPYSLAMVLDSRFPELAAWDVRIWATDLAEASLEYARRGRYKQLEVNRGLPPALLQAYFEQDGAEYCVKPALRKRITFKALNLIERWPSMPVFDVVFLRNVLIYFDVETKRNILGRVKKVLARDGYLFLGGAETTLNIDDSFERVQEGRTVFFRPRP